MRVTLSHCHRLVAKDFLQHIQVASAHHPVRGKGVSQVVKVQIGQPRANAGVPECFLDGTQTASRGPGENVAGSRRGDIAREQLAYRGVHRDMPGLTVLRIPDDDVTGREIEIVPFEIENLASPHPRVQGQRGHRAHVQRKARIKQVRAFIHGEIAQPRIIFGKELQPREWALIEHFPIDRLVKHVAQPAHDPVYGCRLVRQTLSRLPILNLGPRNLSNRAIAELTRPEQHANPLGLRGLEKPDVARDVKLGEFGERHGTDVALVEPAIFNGLGDPLLEDHLCQLLARTDGFPHAPALDRVADRPGFPAQIHGAATYTHAIRPLIPKKHSGSNARKSSYRYY
jgi:hypothetical protein